MGGNSAKMEGKPGLGPKGFSKLGVRNPNLAGCGQKKRREGRNDHKGWAGAAHEEKKK